MENYGEPTYNNNNNNYNQQKQNEEIESLLLKYSQVKKSFELFNSIFEPYQISVEKKMQSIENHVAGNKEIIIGLKEQLEKEKNEKQILIDQIRHVHGLVKLMKNRLDSKESELQITTLRNDELKLDLENVKKELELLKNNDNNNNNKPLK